MRLSVSLLIALVFAPGLSMATAASAETSYLRFEHDGQTLFGELHDGDIDVLSGGLFPLSEPSGERLAVDDVSLLPPTDARKVFAVGMNFASHVSSADDAAPPLFLKLPSSLIGNGHDVHLPSDAANVHFEGELVLVIGKQAKDVAPEDADQYIFGVTVGNDLTERGWQGSDLQWMRAKASDGFGPVGPVIATGLDYNNVMLTTRLNGDVVQQETTANMIHKPAKVVSYLSRYFTLEPGDLVFMGTPGRTRSLDDGDVITVHIDGIGTLENRIVQP